jgi:hypothetical protein
MSSSSNDADNTVENTVITSDTSTAVVLPTSASKLTSNCRVLAAESYKCLETKPHSQCSGNLTYLYIAYIQALLSYSYISVRALLFLSLLLSQLLVLSSNTIYYHIYNSFLREL